MVEGFVEAVRFWNGQPLAFVLGLIAPGPDAKIRNPEGDENGNLGILESS
jgi:hypothetical protein